MAGLFAAAGFIGWTVAAGGGGAADSHKGLRNVGVPGIKLQTAVADNVVRLEHQGIFDVRVVDKLPHGRKERFYVLINTVPDAGRVDADIGHVVLLRQFFDSISLGAKVHPAPLMTLQNSELPARYSWRCHNHAACAVTVLRTFCRVITDPHFAPAKRAQRQRLKIGPDFPAVHHARLQLAEREHGREIVHELTHQQVLVFVRAVLHAQLVEVEQVTAAAHRILHGDDLAVLPVRAEQAARKVAVGQVNIHLVRFGTAPVKQRAGPERIGLVVAALAGVALVIWKYWQPISAFLGGVVEGFKAAAAPISAAFEPLRPVFQWIGDRVQALWGWFNDLLTPVKSTAEELNSAAAMGRRFGEALAEGLNRVMHPLESLKSGVSWLLEKLGIVSKEAAKAKLPAQVTQQQSATVNSDGKVVLPPGGFPAYAGMYDTGGIIPRGQFGIVGENGPEIVNGPANVTSRRRTAALASVVAGVMGVAATPAKAVPLHPFSLPARAYQPPLAKADSPPPVIRYEINAPIHIVAQPGQNAQDIAREVARQLDERERRARAKARSNFSDQGGYES